MSVYNGGTAYQPYKKKRSGLARAKAPVGRQLAHKVQTGEITKKEANQTAYEREVLARAFGPNWREKVFGKGGARGISGSFAPAQIRVKRSQALERARAKLSGGVAASEATGSSFQVHGKPLSPSKPGIGPLPLKKRRLKY